MAIFAYCAKDSQGVTLNGIVEAPVFDEALRLLRKKDLIIISVKETKQKDFNGKKVSLSDLVIFSRQFATMIKAGIVLVRTLQILKDQTKNPALVLAIIDIRDRVLNGSTLHEAMGKHPRIFSKLYVSLVRTGEISGSLDETLERTALYMERTASLQRKVRTALIYPAIVITMALLITSFLLVKVVPTFEGVFRALGGELPLPTRILIAISAGARKFVWVGFIVIPLLVVGFRKYIKTPKGRYRWDRFLIFAPIFGDLVQKYTIAKFARTLSTLVRSAIPILQAFDIVARVTGNVLFEKAILNAARSIRIGEPIADPLAKSAVFPPMVIGMISIGEQSGQLEEMLTKIAELYEEEVDIIVAGLASIIEPVVISFLGIVVGAIVVALLLPIFKITELIR